MGSNNQRDGTADGTLENWRKSFHGVAMDREELFEVVVLRG